MKLIAFIVVAATLLQKQAVSKLLPLIVWHGLNDHCSGSAGKIIAILTKFVKDLYVHCIRITDSGSDSDEKSASVWHNTNTQLDRACEAVSRDEKLKNGFNALGISQGGLLLRALIQKCPPSEVNNFVTLSSPHQGVYGIPNCEKIFPAFMCKWLKQVLYPHGYQNWIQGIAAPIQYWHDPYSEQAFQRKSTFLAEYNNEKMRINKCPKEMYKENFLK
ncbi:palmitoyl-protein thioesterase 1-like, partial [Tropilaelaps mercedesae]